MTTTATAPTAAPQTPAAAQALQVAPLAPPTATVPPSSLGGLDQVRWLAQGLAQRGHHVTLIGADLGGLIPGGYAVVDTDPTGGERAAPELVDRRHAEQAGKALEQLDRVDLVSDHTRAGWLPATGDPPPVTAHTIYRPVPRRPWAPPVALPTHLGLVAVSRHQVRHGIGLPWVADIHPAIPVSEHPLTVEHDGPCVYLGPLHPEHGAAAALKAAHQAGRPIVLAGTTPDRDAAAFAEAELAPRLGHQDQLLGCVRVSERWELLASACCLLAPLRQDTPFSLEIVEAMVCGTPVVTMAGTVGAELVTHGVSGLVLTDPDLLAGAIGRAARLDPRRVRGHAAGRFDVPMMADAYQALFGRLLRR
jgi:Glycosyl transferases group 1